MQLESLPEMIGGVWSEDKSLQLEATTHFRKLLSIGKIFMIEFGFWLLVGCFFVLTIIDSPERSPPINEVVQSGVVPRFVDFLGRDEFPQLQVWFLARLCYSFCCWIHFYVFDCVVLWYWVFFSLRPLGPSPTLLPGHQKTPGLWLIMEPSQYLSNF